MEHKDLKSFHKALDSMDLNQPDVVLISGSDMAVLDATLERLRHRLHRDIGPFETIVFSGESGDEDRLVEEISNIPLFSPYRLLIVRQAAEVLRAILASKARAERFESDIAAMPDRTLLVLEYEGQATKKVTSLFSGLSHLVTRELYSNQIMDAIRAIAGRLHLRLDEEAVQLLREGVEPRSGTIEQALTRLRSILSEEEMAQPVGVERVREVLFPTMGTNAFALVDALFALDHRTVQRELNRFHPGSDSFFGILKLILNRADEIRHAHSGFAMGMSDSELIAYLQLGSRPPFIQKKILSRLRGEISRYTADRLRAIYAFLINIQNDFRSNVSIAHQRLIFEERILEVFFDLETAKT